MREVGETNDEVRTPRDLYVDLLMGCLTRELFLAEETHDVRSLGMAR